MGFEPSMLGGEAPSHSLECPSGEVSILNPAPACHASVAFLNRRGRLWKNRDFMRFWSGQTVSQFGNQFTILALPTIAILVVHASIFQVGLLGAIEFLAFPTIGLFVGVWVDRFSRRPILIACNVGRLTSLSSIPMAFLLNGLSLYQLFAVAGVNGVFQVFFDVAYQSYLPSIVEPSDLVEGNSKLQMSVSAATIIGPTVAGALIGLVGAAISVAVDAIGYLTSVLALSSIRTREQNEMPPGEKSARNFLSELREGVNLTLRTPILSKLTVLLAMSNLGNTIAGTVYLYFAYDQLGLTPLWVGILGTAGGIGFLVGALMAGKVSKKLGIGRALTFSIMSGFAYAAFPLALFLPAIPILIALSFLLSFPVLIFNVVALSLIQRVTPSRLLGRVNATRRTISWGVIPIASFTGGYLGSAIGLPATLVVGGLIAGGAVVWAFFSPIYRLREENELDEFSIGRLADHGDVATRASV